MNGKCPAKVRAAAAVAVTLAAWLIPLSAMADFGNLNQQLRIQQQQSRFQLMLQQVQESARRRAAARAASGEGTVDSTPVALGDWTKTGRLTPITATNPAPRQREAAAERRLRAAQAYERDQRTILEQRQRRDALVTGPRSPGSASDSYAAKRRNLVRYRTQSKRLSLQRKLRR